MDSKARDFPPTPKPKQGNHAKACAINSKSMVLAPGHLENIRGFITNKKQLREKEDEDEEKAREITPETPLLRTPLAAAKVGNHFRLEAKKENLLPDVGRALLVRKINRLVVFPQR